MIDSGYRSGDKEEKKFYIKTFGCQMNKNDSAIIAALLSDRRYEQTVDPETAAIGVQSLLSLNALCLLDKY